MTDLLQSDNELRVNVGRGWYSSPIGTNEKQVQANYHGQPRALLAELHIVYTDDSEEIVKTDETWECGESAIRFSEIYDGEFYDATFETRKWESALKWDDSYDMLIPQEGPEVLEQERVQAQKIIVTPQGDVLVDFGQEVTGYVEFTVEAKQGEWIRILHSEVLDKDGNFYNDNYRLAKAEINYICKEGVNIYHPRLTFFGFRQIKLAEWPGDVRKVRPEQFTAIAVYSEMRQTGHLVSSNAMLNQLFSNVFWGQRGNFLDVPTDCPQRNERLGWTGDAQVFCKAASYNFDVLKFFKKWMHDVYAEQRDNDGGIPEVIPDMMKNGRSPAAWSDAGTIVPYQMYMTYGDIEILEDQFDSMKAWVDYITRKTKTEYLWTEDWHYGDWLALDAEQGSYRGASRDDFIASVFYAYSAELLIKVGKIIGKDVSAYEELPKRIRKKFREVYTEYQTQTEHVLALFFDMTDDKKKVAEDLAALIRKAGRMETGFVGTPYLLHALSDNGQTELAYELLLREKYPSWLYSVTKGATTIWEHWDGIMEDGSFWSMWMNSFNHYAYGSSIDWVYEKAAGIRPLAPGFAKIMVEPTPTNQLDWLEVSIDTMHGKVMSKWSHTDNRIRYDITLPVDGEIVIGEKKYELTAGNYVFWSECE